MATSASTTNYASGSASGTLSSKGIFRIVGFACLIGFLVDMLILAAPPNFGDLQWRVSFLRQFSDRSIIFLLGVAFTMLGTMDLRAWRKQLSMICLGMGVLFMLMTILTIRDGITLQQQTTGTIAAQATQVQTQIEQLKNNPPAGSKVTPEQIQQALDRLSTQASIAQEGAKQQILKTGVSSVGNLLVAGIAMIGLGRYGMRRA